ncbi:MAG: nitrite/sulfite reductase [Armatimonadetes bacterium]|nr:nitrite/sulfite reductase [Armatimonadota bacterium]MDW8121683.1 nitrite/sulfite reductase [Armatimonadota bacterium]
MNSQQDRYPCKAVAQAIAEALAAMDSQPTEELVLKRNYIERLKRQKNPETIVQELETLAGCDYQDISEDDIVRLHWWGMFHDKPKVGYFCIRIRCPGGIVTPAQLKGVGRLSVTFGQNYLELTTRQNFQIHYVHLTRLPEVFHQIQQLGLTTKGGCGDTVRNITGCPVAGLDPHQLFDPTPIIQEASQLFDTTPEYSDLPRKHKITISTCPYWCTAPEINCVALVGAEKEGRKGFTVLAGGGLASTPRLAKPLGIFIEPKDAISVLVAILELWRNNRRYRVSRVKSRFKFMMDDYGPEKIRTMIEQALDRKLDDYPETPRPVGFTNHMGIHPQVTGDAEGKPLYYIGVPVLVGRMKGQDLIRLGEWLEVFGGDFRITRQQNFILTGIPEDRLDDTIALLKDLGYSPNACPLIANGIACTGDPFCNYSVAETKERLARILQHLTNVFGDTVWQSTQLRIHLDGCPHACAQHWVGDIGLQGTAAHLPDGRKTEGFDIVLGGALGSRARIGRPLIRKVPADQVPLVLENLIRAYLEERGESETFQDWALRVGDQRLIQLGHLTTTVVLSGS